MPVDMNIPNSIIAAFQAGSQLKEHREQTALDKEKFKQQTELEKERLKQQKEQFEAEHKLVQQKFDLDKASHALNILTQRQSIGKDITESDNIPPGVGDLTARPKDSTGQEVSPDDLKLFSQALGGIFQVPSHEAAFTRQLGEAGQLAEAKEAPQRTTEKQKLEAQYYLQQIKDKEDYKRAVEVANINAAARVKAGQATADAFLERPINPQIQRDVFGLDKFDPSLNLKNAQERNLIKPLDSGQQAGLKDVSQAEQTILNLQNILNDIGYSVFTKGGLDEAAAAKASDVKASLVGGRTGTIKGKSGKSYNISDIFTALGDLKRSIAVPDFGKVLPKGETEIIQTYVPDSAMNQVGETVKSKLDSLLQRMQNNKAYILKLAQPSGQKQEDIHIYFDAQGNVIPGPK